MDQPKRRLSAVWFADIVGYSELSTRDEPAAMRLVELLQSLCREVVAEHEGRVVKFMGDACLAEFASTDSSVRSAVSLLERYNAGATEQGQHSTLRIGVHLGEVTATPDGDLYGDGINTASRLAAHCFTWTVIISEDVWRQLRQRPEFRFAPLGNVELRGITTQVQVYDVLFGSRAAVAQAVATAAPVAVAQSPATAPQPAPASKLPQLAYFALFIIVGVVIWQFSKTLEKRRQAAAPPASTAEASAKPEPAKPTAASAPPSAAAAPVAEATSPPSTKPPAGGRGARGAMMAAFPPAEVRSLLQRLVDAVNTGSRREALLALGPGAVNMTGRGAQQMKDAFGEGLSMRLGRMDPAGPPDAGRLPIRFVVLAKSHKRAEMPSALQRRGATGSAGTDETRRTASRNARASWTAYSLGERVMKRLMLDRRARAAACVIGADWKEGPVVCEGRRCHRDLVDARGCAEVR